MYELIPDDFIDQYHLNEQPEVTNSLNHKMNIGLMVIAIIVILYISYQLGQYGR